MLDELTSDAEGIGARRARTQVSEKAGASTAGESITGTSTEVLPPPLSPVTVQAIEALHGIRGRLLEVRSSLLEVSDARDLDPIEESQLDDLESAIDSVEVRLAKLERESDETLDELTDLLSRALQFVDTDHEQ